MARRKKIHSSKCKKQCSKFARAAKACKGKKKAAFRKCLIAKLRAR